MEVAGRGQGLITNPTVEHTPVCDRSNPPHLSGFMLQVCTRTCFSNDQKCPITYKLPPLEMPWEK